MSSFLDRYFPEISVFKPVENELEKLSGEDRAFKAWEILLAAKRTNDASFLLIGYVLKRIRDERLYIQLDYDNFSQFLASEELGFSREKAYMCIKTYEYYIEYLELDPERIGQMNISRLSMMVPILKQIEDKQEAIRQIEDMSTLRHGDFIKEVKSKTNKDGKPTVFWSNELDKWLVQYHANITHLHDLGDFSG